TRWRDPRRCRAASARRVETRQRDCELNASRSVNRASHVAARTVRRTHTHVTLDLRGGASRRSERAWPGERRRVARDGAKKGDEPWWLIGERAASHSLHSRRILFNRWVEIGESPDTRSG